MNKIYFLLVISVCAVSFSACKKDLLTTNPSDKLSFSADTLTFDTVFTSLGSDTRSFKIYNHHNQKIKITHISLKGNTGSVFHLNVDGISGTDFFDVEIPAHDSLYVFAEVTIDPTQAGLPFVIEDAVQFETNGNQQQVLLTAYGQNAHFFYGTIIHNQMWFPDKPYVIIHSLEVDSGYTLTITAGCRIFMHADSKLYVKGTLKVLGTTGDSVIFRGDRLENYFVDVPGNWLGIHFLKNSVNNEINNTVINEATWGIEVDSLSNNGSPNLILKNTVIKNCLSAGIRGIEAEVQAENCLIYNIGENNLQLAFGGNYQFTHCSFINLGNITTDHKTPVLYLSNAIPISNTQYLAANMNCTFTNCIIDGSLNNELGTAMVHDADSTYLFNHCLVRTTYHQAATEFSNVLFNADPKFVNATLENFHIKGISPCVDAGIVTSVITDLDGNTRDLQPDLGCYEFQ